MIPKLKPQVSSRSFPPDSIWSTSGECADEIRNERGCRWAGGVLPAHGGNAPASSLNRRACLLAPCAGRRAAPCFAQRHARCLPRKACSSAGDPELGGDPSLWHRGRCRHCRCRHPGSLRCSLCSGSLPVAATHPLGRRRQGAWTPTALAWKVMGKTPKNFLASGRSEKFLRRLRPKLRPKTPCFVKQKSCFLNFGMHPIS